MTLPLAQVCKNTSASVLAARWFCFSPWHGQAMWPTIFIYIAVQIWRTFHFSLPLLKHCPIVSLRIKTPPLFFLRPFLAKSPFFWNISNPLSNFKTYIYEVVLMLDTMVHLFVWRMKVHFSLPVFQYDPCWKKNEECFFFLQKSAR